MVRIGTRGSRLARWQANWVAERLRGLHPGLQVELVEIKTQGDRDRKYATGRHRRSLAFSPRRSSEQFGTGSVDVAVHSLKDLPTQGPADLILAAVPAREMWPTP